MENNKLVPIYEPTLMQQINIWLQMKYDPCVVLRHTFQTAFMLDTMAAYDKLRRMTRNGNNVHTTG